MSGYFTANIVVKRVENTPQNRDRYIDVEPARRNITDIADYTIHGETLEELTRKMTAMQIAGIYDPEYERTVQMMRQREKAKAENTGTYGKILDSPYPA